jgi:hypothetical protein
MAFMSKLMVSASIVMRSLTSRSSAQSYNRSDSTGNELPEYYDSDGGLHAGIAPRQHNEIAVRQRLYAFSSPS